MSNTIDVCPTGYDYEQCQLNELENENKELKKKLAIATKALEEYATNDSYKLCVVYCHYGKPVHASDVAIQALKELKGY